jgi:hypothetical protein
MKVIAHKNLPVRPPVTASIAMWLFLDRYQAPGWIWGVIGTLMAFAWVLYFVGVWLQEQVDVVGDKGKKP